MVEKKKFMQLMLIPPSTARNVLLKNIKLKKINYINSGIFFRNRWTPSTIWRRSAARTGTSATRCTTRSVTWSRNPAVPSTRCRWTWPRPRAWFKNPRPPYSRRPVLYRKRLLRFKEGTENWSRPRRTPARTRRC